MGGTDLKDGLDGFVQDGDGRGVQAAAEVERQVQERATSLRGILTTRCHCIRRWQLSHLIGRDLQTAPRFISASKLNAGYFQCA